MFGVCILKFLKQPHQTPRVVAGRRAINVINNVRNVSEVAVIYCATSNPVQVIVAKVDEGRSVVGIVDGLSSRSIEGPDDKQKRSKLLRELGYKK